MRAPTNEATGTSGQSIVKAQFERLRWGAVLNSEHDLGTDLWLMARDTRRFELGALVGAQVKSGISWFGEPEVVDGSVVGWWFRESDHDHFAYWTDHSVPHIVVLNRPSDDKSFWVHVTPSRVVPTGKGRKILVPADATIDEDHLDELLDVAMSHAQFPQWQGSVWEHGQDLPETSVLRFALMTPRLVAPHPNNRPTAISPEQAIAMLVQMRISDLDRWKNAEPLLDWSTARESSIWEWRFFAALRACLIKGDPDHLQDVVDTAPTPHARAAATVALASIRFEEGRVGEALAIVESALAPDDANPIDHAWLQMHQARLLVELGELSKARDEALHAARIGPTAPADPTAAMLTGAASELIFGLSNWDDDSLASVIRGRDNVASWWRSQTLVAGLSKQVEEEFNTWANDQTVTWGAEDTVWLKLRAAMLLSGHAADTPSWRHAASLLGRRVLMTAQGDDAIVMALDLLRIAGAEKVVKLAATRLLEAGPVTPLATVVGALDLAASTRTSIRADLRLVSQGADVLTEEAADRHARWAIDVLSDLETFDKKFRPHFIVRDELIGMLRADSVAVSETVEDEIRQHVVDLPPLTDDLSADRYARLVRFLDEESWTADQVDQLTSRGDGDQPVFLVAIDRVRAIRSSEFRDSLAGRVANGDLDALNSFGSVTDLPPSAVLGMVSALASKVNDRVAASRQGTFGLGGPDVLRALVLLNAWHPYEADWPTCVSALSEPELLGADSVGAVELLGRLARQVPSEVAEALKDPLQSLVTRTPTEAGIRIFSTPADPRGPAALTLAQLFPHEASDTDLLRLLRGDTEERAAAVGIVIAAKRTELLTLLAALTKDSDVRVRAAIARGLAEWVVGGTAEIEAVELLDELLDEPGTRLGLAASAALDEESVHAGLEPLLDRLDTHPSAVVRYRSRRARSLIRTMPS